jgi:hypothetical protein
MKKRADGTPFAPQFAPPPDGTILQAAIDRLTLALTTASDEVIGELGGAPCPSRGAACAPRNVSRRREGSMKSGRDGSARGSRPPHPSVHLKIELPSRPGPYT